MQETLEKAGPARPTAITIIAWVFIALGILMLLIASLAIAAHMLMKAMAGGNMPLPAENAPAPFRFMARIFRHFDVLAYFQIALASFIMLAGYYFLKLRNWARAALEVVSWLGAAYIIGFGIFWITAWTGATATMPAAEQVPELPRLFSIFGVIMGAVVTISMAAPIGVAVWYLRSKTVRDAVR